MITITLTHEGYLGALCFGNCDWLGYRAGGGYRCQDALTVTGKVEAYAEGRAQEERRQARRLQEGDFHRESTMLIFDRGREDGRGR